jgi:hypothetical protein
MLLLHLVNRLLALLLGLALVAAAVLACVEVVRWALDSGPWLVPWPDWGAWLSDARASDPAVLIASGVAAALGLLLLLFELKRRTPDAFEAEPLLPGVATGVTRRGVESAVTSAARGVSGVSGASSRMRRGRVTVTARSRVRGQGEGLDDRVRQAVEEQVSALALRRKPTARVRMEEAR